jgi:hypothetical protein
MPRNFKGIIFQRNRDGLVRAFTKKDPSFHICFTLLNQWLTASTKLSRKNIIFGHKYVIQLRENELWHTDLEKQKQVDRLDELLAKAKERLQKREEERAEAKAEAPVPKQPRGPKPTTFAPAEPEKDPADLWAQFLEEDKKP